MIDYIAAQVDFPEIDVRQRSPSARATGEEIYIPDGLNFVGQTITQTQLRESDINVLTLYRGAKSHPNLSADRLFEAG